jgi:hypothetical protein
MHLCIFQTRLLVRIFVSQDLYNQQSLVAVVDVTCMCICLVFKYSKLTPRHLNSIAPEI